MVYVTQYWSADKVGLDPYTIEPHEVLIPCNSVGGSNTVRNIYTVGHLYGYSVDLLRPRVIDVDFTEELPRQSGETDLAYQTRLVAWVREDSSRMVYISFPQLVGPEPLHYPMMYLEMLCFKYQGYLDDVERLSQSRLQAEISGELVTPPLLARTTAYNVARMQVRFGGEPCSSSCRITASPSASNVLISCGIKLPAGTEIHLDELYALTEPLTKALQTIHPSAYVSAGTGGSTYDLSLSVSRGSMFATQGLRIRWQSSCWSLEVDWDVSYADKTTPQPILVTNDSRLLRGLSGNSPTALLNPSSQGAFLFNVEVSAGYSVPAHVGLISSGSSSVDVQYISADDRFLLVPAAYPDLLRLESNALMGALMAAQAAGKVTIQSPVVQGSLCRVTFSAIPSASDCWSYTYQAGPCVVTVSTIWN